MNILQEFSILFLIVSSGVTFLLGYRTYQSDPNSATNRIFLALCLAIPFWLVVFTVSTRPDIAGHFLLMAMRASLVLSILVNILFVLIAHTFPSHSLRVSGRYIWFWSLLALLVGGIACSPLTFAKVTVVEGAPVPELGPGMLAFALFNLIAYTATFYIFRKRLRATAAPEERRALFSLSIGMFLMISLMFFTISLPVALYNFTLFLPLAPLYALMFITFVTYGVLKHQLFNAKVVATEMFVVILSIVFLARMSAPTSWMNALPDVAIFISIIFFGSLLIKSVKAEIKQREEIRKLADTLAETNTQLETSNERLRVMDQRKSEFVSIASHQLRTPVTAMKGYASLLLEGDYGKLTEKMKDPIQKIFHSSDRLVEMISDFLNVSKIEQGTMTYTFAPTDLKKMVTDLVQDFHVVAGEKKINLKSEIPEGEHFNVTADEGKIRQIISNLIDNSIKYTPKGSVRVRLRKDPLRSEHGSIVLEIKDTGIGLSQDDIHHLFGKFTRGEEGSKVNTGGSGLGLYIAKKMMEEHKGDIWVDSEGKGKGSTFCIELPEYHGDLIFNDRKGV